MEKTKTVPLRITNSILSNDGNNSDTITLKPLSRSQKRRFKRKVKKTLAWGKRYNKKQKNYKSKQVVRYLPTCQGLIEFSYIWR